MYHEYSTVSDKIHGSVCKKKGNKLGGGEEVGSKKEKEKGIEKVRTKGEGDQEVQKVKCLVF